MKTVKNSNFLKSLVISADIFEHDQINLFFISRCLTCYFNLMLNFKAMNFVGGIVVQWLSLPHNFIQKLLSSNSPEVGRAAVSEVCSGGDL